MEKENLIWFDRKRIWCGLPLSFTKYGISKDRAYVESGLFTTTECEVRLYRIINIRLSRTFIQKIFGFGTIHVDSNDKDLKCFEFKNIKDAVKVKELLSERVEEERRKNRVSTRENMLTGEDSHDLDEDSGGGIV